MSDLELEKLELEKLELELELKKREIELKKQELMQQEEREKVEVIEETVVEDESPEDTELEENEKEELQNTEVVEIKAENKEVGINYDKILDFTKSKYFKIGLVMLFIGMIFLGKFNEKKQQEYYDSIPLILENPEQYYGMTYEDVIAIYGKPINEDSVYFEYQFEGYELDFSFEHEYVSMISYEPVEPYAYRNLTDAFYLFGLEDKASKYKYDNRNTSIFRCTDSSYVIKSVGLYEPDYESKTCKHVIVYFKEHPVKVKKVFEDDFTNVPVIYNLPQYLGMNKIDIFNILGGNVKINSVDYWECYTDLGRVGIHFDKFDKIYAISFQPKEPMKYENSTQEIMVMFGVDPKSKSIRLEDSYGYGGNYNEEYINNDGKWSLFQIEDINLYDNTINFVRIGNYKKKE